MKDFENIKTTIKSFSNKISFFEDYLEINNWDEELKSQKFDSIRISSNYINYFKLYYSFSYDFTFKISFNDFSIVNILFISDNNIYLFPPVVNDTISIENNSVKKFYKNFLKFLFEQLKLKKIVLNLPYVNKNADFFYFTISKYNNLKCSFDMFINLNLTKEEIWSSLRKSYKPIIKKCENNYKLIVSNSNDSLYELKNLHFEVSGKKTRNDETWEIQKKMIEENQAVIFKIFLDNEKLGMSFFSYDKTTAYYDVGVYKRNLERKYFTTHFMLWKAICFFKEKGLSKIYLDKHINSEDSKVKDIIKFKSGFSNQEILSVVCSDQ